MLSTTLTGSASGGTVKPAVGRKQYTVVFNGRVVTRLRHRICRDGTLATTGQARLNDMPRIVH
eukprot:5696379-Pyramimonas_sp.AAC.1